MCMYILNNLAVKSSTLMVLARASWRNLESWLILSTSRSKCVCTAIPWSKSTFGNGEGKSVIGA
uniref:Uncharacterized protein n=1 Tax=Anguilla anguilla TaxID=7936 RepID=A0A0E9UC82_ANGAN